MKKGLLLVAIMAMSLVAYAQPRAIGGRLGYGLELSYQHALGENNMVSAELGLNGFRSLDLVATYDWINPGGIAIPWTEKGSWNWYAGVGAGLQASFPYKTVSQTITYTSNSFAVMVAGRLGIEYNFWFPLQLSIDYRPMMGPYFGTTKKVEEITGAVERDFRAGFSYGALYAGNTFALSVRYLF